MTRAAAAPSAWGLGQIAPSGKNRGVSLTDDTPKTCRIFDKVKPATQPSGSLRVVTPKPRSGDDAGTDSVVEWPQSDDVETESVVEPPLDDDDVGIDPVIEPPKPDDAETDLVVERPRETRRRLTQRAIPRAEQAFRLAPLVRVVRQKPERLVLVGEWRIAVTPQPLKLDAHKLRVTLEVHDLRVWSEDSNWAQAVVMPTADLTVTLAPTGQSPSSSRPTVDFSFVVRWLRAFFSLFSSHPVKLAKEASRPTRPTIDAVTVERALCAFPLFGAHPVDLADAQSLAAVVCKASAEASRGAVKGLRGLRYDLEAELSWALEGTKKDFGLPFVARLARIGTAVGQARDAGRAAVREGFWLYLDDKDAYHAYRKAVDPSLLTDTRPATAATKPWMRDHDTGVRQCRALEEELTEETSALAGILHAATAVALSREAEIQDEFNRWAGVAALGLGLPSVVLAYLGASEKLQLYPFDFKIFPVLAVFAALGMAFSLTRTRLPEHTKREAWVFLGLLALLILGTGLAAGVAENNASKVEQARPSPVTPKLPG